MVRQLLDVVHHAIGPLLPFSRSPGPAELHRGVAKLVTSHSDRDIEKEPSVTALPIETER